MTPYLQQRPRKGLPSRYIHFLHLLLPWNIHNGHHNNNNDNNKWMIVPRSWVKWRHSVEADSSLVSVICFAVNVDGECGGRRRDGSQSTSFALPFAQTSKDSYCILRQRRYWCRLRFCCCRWLYSCGHCWPWITRLDSVHGSVMLSLGEEELCRGKWSRRPSAASKGRSRDPPQKIRSTRIFPRQISYHHHHHHHDLTH